MIYRRLLSGQKNESGNFGNFGGLVQLVQRSRSADLSLDKDLTYPSNAQMDADVRVMLTTLRLDSYWWSRPLQVDTCNH